MNSVLYVIEKDNKVSTLTFVPLSTPRLPTNISYVVKNHPHACLNSQ